MSKRFYKPLLLAALLTSAFAHADRTKVEFWTFNTAQFAPFFNDVVQKYNKANPNYEAVWNDMNWDQIQPKLVAAIAAGNPPALVNFNVPWTHEFANKNMLAPLDDLMGSDKAVYLPGALKDLSVKGKIYGFPYYNSVSVIAYNKELLDKSGVKATPKTFDEFIATARKITEKTGVPAFSPKLATKSGDGGMIPWFVYMGLPIFENGKAVFNSPKHVAALQTFVDLYKQGVVPRDSFRIEFEQEIANYGNGKLAMMTTAPTALKKLGAQSDAMYKKTAIMPFPLGGANMALGGWLMSFVMPKDFKDQQAAAKLGLLLTNDDAQLAFAKATGTTFPSSKKANENDFFSSGANGGDPVGVARATAAQSMAFARTPILPADLMPDEAAMRAEFNDEIQDAIEGRKTAKAALDVAAKKWNDRLAKK
ncbi:putative chitobiose transport system substrate-binding protein [Andreprevotia lacus DSM 23236]|jgi:putative chitobiose transport system substrate-binding protein|uniref:Putative chitobiose transport system substrate-binding protein n=1 Tax=Andreprevotia lacus DSM 23236 TaxID=1121001 RepID=A0A1W1WYS8_9NEIS|nr:sugar ABC transporter substrate-binding protein [Andreprevotia lacus]SMC16281.1 putative chitobiose transport system substrate-binding protein [Andreprevotia lacus DSM 23236]